MVTRATATKEVARPGQTGVSTELADQFKQYAGAGVSTDAADNMVPLIYVLQPLSPQVDRRNAGEFIEGAEPGDIWLRNSAAAIAKGEQGFEFQPCYFYKEFVEWVPRDDGGGFVGRHDFKMVDGQELILTRYHAGYALRDNQVEPYIIPFTSTGHTVSRGWMQQMNTQPWSLVPGARAPAFAYAYRITTRQRENKQGRWFQIQIGAARELADKESLDRGLALLKAFESGAKRAEEPPQAGGTASGNDGASTLG
jgi:hypothetical protein